MGTFIGNALRSKTMWGIALALVIQVAHLLGVELPGETDGNGMTGTFASIMALIFAAFGRTVASGPLVK